MKSKRKEETIELSAISNKLSLNHPIDDNRFSFKNIL